MGVGQQDLSDWMRGVEQQLRTLAGRSQIRPPQNTAVSADFVVGPTRALQVLRADGAGAQFLIGQDGGSRVARFWRADGTLAFSTVTQTTIWDGAGTAVVGDDAGGTGLGRPYIPVPWAPARTTDWLATTSATFEDVWRMSPLKINPRATVTIGHIADAGTTGDVQVTINGSATGSPAAVATTAGSTVVGPFALPGAQEATVELRVQARRTGGAGSIRVAVLAATGFHS